MKRLGVSFSVLLFLVMAIFTIATRSTSAQVTGSESKISPQDNSETNSFGGAAALYNNTLVVGAKMGDDLDSNPSILNSGATYVYQWDGLSWVEFQKLVASDSANSDQFGIDVDIDGDLMVVGANFADIGNVSNAGAAYIFRRIGAIWVEEAKLFSDVVETNDRFGTSVAISNGVVVIGAPLQGVSDIGAVYIFEEDDGNWQETETVIPADSGKYFGRSVDINNDVIVVGRYGDDDQGSLSGSAHIFRLVGNNWVEEQKLLPQPNAAQDQFGWSVAISDNVSVIGAPLDDDEADASGAAYVFRWNGAIWAEEQKLTATDGDVADQFGWSIGMENDAIIIGAYADDDFGNDSGSAYIFERDADTWVQEQKLTGADVGAGDYFGVSVALSDDHIVAGTIGDDDNGTNSGAAYIFERLIETPLGDIFQPAEQFMSFRASTAVALDDLNNDGLIDAIVGNLGSSVPDHVSRVWINQGNDIFIDIGESLQGAASDIALGDLDGDDDVDAAIILSSSSLYLSIWENDGDAHFNRISPFNPQGAFQDIALGDLDGDSDLDLVTASTNGARIWLNDGNANFSENINQFGGNPPLGTKLALADLDKDTDLDLVLVNSTGNSSIWMNDAGTFSDSAGEINVRYDDLSVDDFNNDGDLDVFFVGTSEGSSVWFNDGAGQLVEGSQNLMNIEATQIVTADFNNDGHIDALIPTSDGDIWLNTGYGYFEASGEELPSRRADDVASFAIGDTDNDGDMDIFIAYNYLANTLPAPNRLWVNQTNSSVACDIGSDFVETNGQVVIEAIHYSYSTPGTGNVSTMLWGWHDGETPPQSALQVLPDSGISTSLNTNGPELGYVIQFASAGDYYVFVKGKAPSTNAGGGDSVHIGLDGAAITANSGFGLTGFKTYSTWQNLSNHANGTGQATLINIPSAGQYTLNVWPREDGFILDKILIELADPNHPPSINNNDTQIGPPETLCPPN